MAFAPRWGPLVAGLEMGQGAVGSASAHSSACREHLVIWSVHLAASLAPCASWATSRGRNVQCWWDVDVNLLAVTALSRVLHSYNMLHTYTGLVMLEVIYVWYFTTRSLLYFLGTGRDFYRGRVLGWFCPVQFCPFSSDLLFETEPQARKFSVIFFLFCVCDILWVSKVHSNCRSPLRFNF